MKATAVVSGTSAVLLAASISFSDARHPLFVWNLTPSVPRGLYWLSSGKQAGLGDLVASQLPATVANFAAKRGYLAHHVPVAKEIIGIPGDTVCAIGSTVYLNGAKIIDRKDHDQFGRPMPSWRGCVVLAPEQVFLALPRVEQSFDGRYFGPTPVANIEGRLHPIWTF